MENNGNNNYNNYFTNIVYIIYTINTFNLYKYINHKNIIRIRFTLENKFMKMMIYFNKIINLSYKNHRKHCFLCKSTRVYDSHIKIQSNLSVYAF